MLNAVQIVLTLLIPDGRGLFFISYGIYQRQARFTSQLVLCGRSRLGS